MQTPHLNRRHLLLGAAGLAALGTVGPITSPAHAVEDGHGLRVLPESGPVNDRLQYFRFETAQISWNPGVNILLPDGYHSSGKSYPVIYLFHGGQGDFIFFDNVGIQQATAGQDVIIVMPDGGQAGWHCNPVNTITGPKNWETFHIGQLLPWVESNFRTFSEYDGRAVAGYSMGGFGALKYAAKYFGDFCAVTSISGPASIRRDAGLVAQWMQTSATVDLGVPGGIYGIPWREDLVTADNAVERVESFRNKRVALYAGTQDDLQEPQVLAGHREFAAKLNDVGIPFHRQERDRTHLFHPGELWEEIPEIVGRMRTAG